MPEIDFFAAFRVKHEAIRLKSGGTGGTGGTDSENPSISATFKATAAVPPTLGAGGTGVTNLNGSKPCSTCSTDDPGRWNRNTSTISTLLHPFHPVPPENQRVASCTAPDDDDPEERAGILEFDAHLPRHEAERLAGITPAADDGPHHPCPKCGCRNFWRPSGTREPWQCGRCASIPRNVWTDCVALPPKAGQLIEAAGGRLRGAQSMADKSDTADTN